MSVSVGSDGDDLTGFLTRFFALLQLCPFLWVVSDLLEDADLARRILLAYALGAATSFWLVLALGAAPEDVRG